MRSSGSEDLDPERPQAAAHVGIGVVEAERLDPDQDLIRGGNRIGSSEMASTSGPPYSVTMMARMMTFLLAHCFWLFDQNQAVNNAACWPRLLLR
jgi:hypothetical protein